MSALGKLSGIIFTVALLCGPAQAGDEETLARGAYLAKIMDCGGCHTTGMLAGAPAPDGYLAGSDIGFEIPGLGVFYPPNLTSDRQTGLGDWSAEEIAAAIVAGQRPDGRELAPIMPWQSYGAITVEDLEALVAFLQSLPPVDHQVPALASAETATAPYLSMVMPSQ